MLRIACAVLLAVDASGYFNSFSYSSGCGMGQMCTGTRSLQSPSMRSSANNCGGNCCMGTGMGRSGSCLPRNNFSSYTISSSNKPRFQKSMSLSPNSFKPQSSRQPMQMISSRSAFSQPSFSQPSYSQPRASSKPRTSWSSWSSWGMKPSQPMKPLKPVFQQMKPVKPASRSSVGKAWGPNCVLCSQPAPAQKSRPFNQQPRRGCAPAHTRVGSSCRRSQLLTGPAAGKSTNDTGNCYRVGQCGRSRARNTPPPTAPPTQPPTTQAYYQPIEVLDYSSSSDDQSRDSVYVDCIDCDFDYGQNGRNYQPDQSYQQDYQQQQSNSNSNSDYSSSSEERYNEYPARNNKPAGRAGLRRRRLTQWNSWGSSGQEVEEEERQEEYYQPQRRRQRAKPRSRGCRYPHC